MWNPNDHVSPEVRAAIEEIQKAERADEQMKRREKIDYESSDAELMHRILAQIYQVCHDNAPDACNHRIALALVGQLAAPYNDNR